MRLRNNIMSKQKKAFFLLPVRAFQLKSAVGCPCRV
jgi:hypothetical protein